MADHPSHLWRPYPRLAKLGRYPTRRQTRCHPLDRRSVPDFGDFRSGPKDLGHSGFGAGRGLSLSLDPPRPINLLQAQDLAQRIQIIEGLIIDHQLARFTAGLVIHRDLHPQNRC